MEGILDYLKTRCFQMGNVNLFMQFCPRLYRSVFTQHRKMFLPDTGRRECSQCVIPIHCSSVCFVNMLDKHNYLSTIQIVHVRLSPKGNQCSLCSVNCPNSFSPLPVHSRGSFLSRGMSPATLLPFKAIRFSSCHLFLMLPEGSTLIYFMASVIPEFSL